MPEPHSTTAGVIVGAGIGLTGTIMGAQLDALLLGMIAAILVSFWLPTIDNRGRAAAAVALSSLFAGYGSPLAAARLAVELGGADATPLRLLMALAIGTGGPMLIPLILRRAAGFAQGGQGNGQ
ncbi:MAG: hypothetical protein HZC22_13425 [Rhodocyclales bacterium]|nr:hypothetical protein [Rhodocyclales bacterium]